MTTELGTQLTPVPARGNRLPGFSGKTPAGNDLRLRDFYQRRNLALVFTHGPECDACRRFLEELAARRPAVQAEDGEILAVLGGPAENAADLPFPAVLDQDGEIHRRYGLLDAQGEPLAAVLLSDRYGIIFASAVADDRHALLPVDEVIGWLEFIACRCS